MALRYILNATAFRSPLLRTLVPTVALAYGIQAAVAVPSMAAQSERFYDLSGSLTYISCAAASLYLPTLRARLTALGSEALKAGVANATIGSYNWRQLALTAAVGVWATRLGSYLFSRITADNGQDSRFDNIRTSAPKFFGAFMAQATWVSLCLLPVIGVNALQPAAFATLPALTRVSDAAGAALFLAGFCIEVAADRQKDAWLRDRRAKRHSEEFLTRGLWARSRHPNYFGEMMLWAGVAVLAGGVLASSARAGGPLGWGGGPAARAGAVLMAAVSPAFTVLLLTKVGGIPLSEGKYDKRYGHRKDYQEWKRNTPLLVPKLF